MADCNFANNAAYYGGAIVFENNGNVENCNFVNNTAIDGDGGAINMGSGTLTSCNFADNHATGSGGAVYFYRHNSTVTDCVFISNCAGNFSAVHLSNGTGNISGCLFINNSAESGVVGQAWDSYNQMSINNNIFLNNAAGDVIYFANIGNMNTDYNWFGNNATNYDAAPNADINNWLFLNATAEPSLLSVSDSSQITFKLYSYDSTGTSDYDNGKLPAVNLTLVATNGNVKGTAKLGEDVTYTAASRGTGSVTASVENAACTIELDIREKPELSVDSQEVYYSNNTVISLNYNSTATGKVNITLKGKKFSYELTGMTLNATVSLGKVSPDEYNVTVAYLGDEIFLNATAKATLTVNPIVDLAANITSDRDVYFIGDDAVWTITVYSAGNGTDATGVVVEEYFPSQYFEYAGHNADKGTFDNETMTWDIGFMENGTKATLHIYCRAKLSKTHITNRVIVSCNETDWNIYNNFAYSYADVEKQNSTVDLNDTVMDYGNAVNVTPTTTGATGITAEINGINATVYGFTVEIPVMDAGTYNLTVTTVPDENHTAANRTVTITVNKVNSTLTVDNVVLDYGESTNVTATTEGATGITAKIGEEDAEVEGFTIRIPVLDSGNYTLKVTTVPDENHNPVTKTVDFEVKKANATVNTTGSVTYNGGKDITMTFADANGNPISNATVAVDLNGFKDYGTDENGQIKVSAKGLAPDTYAVKVEFRGTDNYNGFNTTVKVTVKKAASKITAKAKNFKTTTKTKKYTVTLKANGKALKNKWVYLKVNGKTYKAKTNSKGKATFRITKLSKAGKFKATVTYKGNDYYKKTTKKVKLTVKSAFKTISKGNKKHATVKKIQRALKNNGYYLSYNGHYLKVDGIYHIYTEMAVKQFQKARGLKVTGKVDEKTAKKLKII